ncbi:hypothetical protein [Xanthomonas phage RTH11]|nr:hypothetical protein [Xanthomonas phage RTH11]
MSNPVLDFTKAPKQILLDLINAENSSTLTSPLTDAQVTFAVPAVEDGAKNTSLELSSVVGGPYLGQRSVYYDRLDLAAVLALKSARFEKTDEVTTVAHVIAAINARYKINLTSDDFTATEFPTWELVPNEEHTVTLTAKAGSLIFIGTGVVTLYLPQVALADAIPNNTLSGLTYVPPAD